MPLQRQVLQVPPPTPSAVVYDGQLTSAAAAAIAAASEQLTALAACGLPSFATMAAVAPHGGPCVLGQNSHERALQHQVLPVLAECGISCEALEQLSAAAPQGFDALCCHLPLLHKLGFAAADILQLASQPSGHQALAELVQWSPELLRQHYFHDILVACATVPGALQLMPSMPKVCSDQTPLQGSALEASIASGPSVVPPAAGPVQVSPLLNGTEPAEGCVGPPLPLPLAPITLDKQDQWQLGKHPRGASRVESLQKFCSHLDSARLNKKSVVAAMLGRQFESQLRLVQKLAPILAKRGHDLTDAFGILIGPGGASALQALYDVGPTLMLLGYGQAMQLELARRPGGEHWIHGLAEHSLALFALGWQPAQLSALSFDTEIDATLSALRSRGPWLCEAGFDLEESVQCVRAVGDAQNFGEAQALWLKGLELGFGRAGMRNILILDKGTSALAALTQVAPVLLAEGFTQLQIEGIAQAKQGTDALEKLRSFAAPLLSFGYTAAELVWVAGLGEGAQPFDCLYDSSIILGSDKVPPFIVLRLLNRRQGIHHLVAVLTYWRPLRNMGVDSAFIVGKARNRAISTAAFVLWAIEMTRSFT